MRTQHSWFLNAYLRPICCHLCSYQATFICVPVQKAEERKTENERLVLKKVYILLEESRCLRRYRTRVSSDIPSCVSHILTYQTKIRIHSCTTERS